MNSMDFDQFKNELKDSVVKQTKECKEWCGIYECSVGGCMSPKVSFELDQEILKSIHNKLTQTPRDN